ncbi:MAG: ABC transporter permease subunit [Actinomycetota bacterium]|nr:ABC transporter permease subunit [Actinomycetota bacterium]
MLSAHPARQPPRRAPTSEPGERLAHACCALAGAASLAVLGLVVGYVLWRAWPAFETNGLSYFSNRHNPGLARELGLATQQPRGVAFRELHAWPAIYGTLLTTGGAILLGLPFSLLTAIFVAELAPRPLGMLMEPLVRIMAAVPSVVWGLFGLLVLAPFIDRVFISDDLASRYARVVPLRGESILLGILVLVCMTVPFQVAIFTDALRAVPAPWREGGRALGLDAWRVTLKILLPVIRPAIATGVVLATGRAIGEAIALSMTTGGLSFVPNPLDRLVFLLEPARPLASTIVDFHSEGVLQGALAADLFSFAALILLSALAMMLAVRLALAPVRARGVL